MFLLTWHRTDCDPDSEQDVFKFFFTLFFNSQLYLSVTLSSLYISLFLLFVFVKDRSVPHVIWDVATGLGGLVRKKSAGDGGVSVQNIYIFINKGSIAPQHMCPWNKTNKQTNKPAVLTGTSVLCNPGHTVQPHNSNGPCCQFTQ